jgi:hypothetical protein
VERALSTVDRAPVGRNQLCHNRQREPAARRRSRRQPGHGPDESTEGTRRRSIPGPRRCPRRCRGIRLNALVRSPSPAIRYPASWDDQPHSNPADGNNEIYDPERGDPFHEASSRRLPVVTVVPRLGPVHRVAWLGLVDRVGRFCPLHRRCGVCWVRPLHRVLPLGCERDVGTLVVVGDGVAIKEILRRFRCEALAGSDRDERRTHPEVRRARYGLD